ncbi:MAG: arsenosugar biosynthesis radical SAM (seleno)protein ArsS [Acidobacteriota bacterium]
MAAPLLDVPSPQPGLGSMRGLSIDRLQVNIGLRCNMTCNHCHLEGSPERTEEMDWPTMEAVLGAVRKARIPVLDVTGGAPEMHPHFRRLVTVAWELGLQLVLHTNLTILLEEQNADLPLFLRRREVRVVASLPSYVEKEVDRQRGKWAFRDSIEAIRRLNAVGYGVHPKLELELVHTPIDADLPACQEALEAEYRRELRRRHGVEFTRLLTMTEMPIGRFLRRLERQGRLEHYANLLQEHFNPATLGRLMCRHQVYVRWDGALCDCDFNCALGTTVHPEAPQHIRDFDAKLLRDRSIVTTENCFGCAAGAGSSCAGALV